MPLHKKYTKTASSFFTIIHRILDDTKVFTMTPHQDPSGFEGVEKRIELLFRVPLANANGVRELDRKIWDEVCSLAKCTILHHEPTSSFDSYILSESSLFVFFDKVMIKTCGTTVPLNCVEYIVSKAKELGIVLIDMVYSRSSFMFPGEQVYPHDDLKTEIEYLENMDLGEGNVAPGKSCILGEAALGSGGKYWFVHRKDLGSDLCRQDSSDYRLNVATPDNRTLVGSSAFDQCVTNNKGAVTLDIIMTGIDKNVTPTYYLNADRSLDLNELNMAKSIRDNLLGFKSITGKCFDPCGYSCNAHADERYMTIHVTPEDAFSYVSVETVFFEPTDIDDEGMFHMDLSKKVEADAITRQIESFIQRTTQYFNPKECLVTVLSQEGTVSAHDLPMMISNNKEMHLRRAQLFTSGNLLGEDIVASSVFYSGVSSGTTGTKPTGLS